MILILGGTGEARQLGHLVKEAGYSGRISMAGVTVAPADQALPVRVGGFGGEEGLRDYLRAEKIRLLVDATHPFSRDMTARAARIAAAEGLPYLRLERPGWEAGAQDHWISVREGAQMRRYLPRSARIFMATGPGHVADFGLEGFNVLCRRIDEVEEPAPPGWRWLVARPPFTEAEEIALFQREKITHLVTKNSGGEQTAAKLAAARHLRLPVVMLERRPLPEGIEIVANIWAALDWVKRA